MCTFCGVTDSIFLLTTELMQAEVISNNVHFFILTFMSRHKQDIRQTKQETTKMKTIRSPIRVKMNVCAIRCFFSASPHVVRH